MQTMLKDAYSLNVNAEAPISEKREYGNGFNEAESEVQYRLRLFVKSFSARLRTVSSKIRDKLSLCYHYTKKLSMGKFDEYK